MDLPLLLLALAFGLAVGAAAVWFVTRARAEAEVAKLAALGAQLQATVRERDAALARVEEIRASRAELANEFKVLSQETLALHSRSADESAEVRLRATEQVLSPVRESLDQLNRRLTEVERQRTTLGAELGAQVQAVRSTGDELRRETAALAAALRKPQVRGAWGEMQLRRVVEVAGMVEHCDFVTQPTSVSSEDRTIRPDLRVELGQERFVFVDAKAPLAAYLAAQETTDDEIRAAEFAAFSRHVRGHIDALSGKNYFKAGPGSPEFVVMFLPSEALAFEALAQQPDLHEYAARRNVVIASPATLIAMLRAVAYGWKQAALAESAAEVFTLGRELYDRLGTLGSHVAKVGRSLNGAVNAYNVAVGSLESRVLVTGRRLRDLGLTEADLVTPAGCEAVARPLTAPELVSPPPEPRPAATHGTLPEAAELVRGEPDLAEIVSSVPPPGAQGKIAR